MSTTTKSISKSDLHVRKQLDYEFLFDPVPGTSLFQIRYKHHLSAVLPSCLRGYWSSPARAAKAVANWKDSIRATNKEDLSEREEA